MQTPPFPQPCIFLVGYPRSFRLELTEGFQEQGYTVYVYQDARLAAHSLGYENPIAVLLNSPQSGPLSCLEFIERYGGLLPVLVLSPNASLLNVVQSLRAGAADYMRVPCHFPEILARVERAAEDLPAAHNRVSVGKVSVDVVSAVLHIEHTVMRITPREARLLAALMRSPERPIHRSALMRTMGIAKTAKPSIIESYIKQLRKRHPLLRRCIRTKYGQGYAYFPEREA